MLNKFENYKLDELNCYPFRSSKDVVKGVNMRVGNMVGGYPFVMNGIPFYTSESAYIVGAFSNDTVQHQTIQKELVECKNGFQSKKFIRKPHEHEKRSDWESFNVDWMKYVVWCKCIGNGDFANLLLSIPDDGIIIEDSTTMRSTTSRFWGCTSDGKGCLSGCNVMGKILMECRQCLRDGTTPKIDFERLKEKNIFILGKKIDIFES